MFSYFSLKFLQILTCHCQTATRMNGGAVMGPAYQMNWFVTEFQRVPISVTKPYAKVSEFVIVRSQFQRAA